MASTLEPGCILEVDLLDWANEWVGKQCLRCEAEVKYVPLGVTDGRSDHRIECDCTVIETSGRDRSVEEPASEPSD